MNWDLENVRETAKAHSDFELPSENDVKSLVPGDFAKLLFRFPQPDRHHPNAERMWVNITGAFQCGCWLGRLSNDPLYAPLKIGDKVEFSPEHVLAIMKKDTAVTGKEEINWVRGDQNNPHNWKHDARNN